MSEGFRYAEVEDALAQVHDIDEAARSTFNARIKHLQRIGLSPATPGKGQRISYSAYDVVFWALCLAFLEAGLPPNIVKNLMDQYHGVMRSTFAGPIPKDDIFFCLRGNFLKWQLDGETAYGPKSFAIIPISQVQLSFLSEAKNSRSLLINLTEIKRKLGAVLKHDWSATAGEPKSGRAQ